MGPVEIVRSAFRGVGANKLRSALTTLGVLIGVAAVILLVAVGNGSAQSISDRIEALGTNTITVSASGGGSTGLTVEVAEALHDPVLAPDVRSVSPVVSTSATLTYGDADHSVGQFVGSYPSYLAASNTQVDEGAAFTDADVAQGRRVALVGQTVVDELFAGADPLGSQLMVDGALFTVVGVLAEKTSSGGLQDANDLVVAPLSAVRQALTGYGSISSVLVEATGPDRVDAAQAQVSAILDRRLASDSAGGAGGTGVGGTSQAYRIQNASQLLETQASTAETFTVLLGAVAAISLLVGGIGITNIMLVTVTERTREIGIRKALGAPPGTIMTQFLVEATLLSAIGGAAGVAVAVIGSRFTIVGVEPVIVPSSVLLALGVSVAIGLFFGSVPARRAANLRPIDALRYE
ncbi:putative ABC transport system permease protein [Micromonospora sp. Llam0]|uniref:ABC transporter permease n=1 Tax=Micromonospora sp. Llam0 TaxID=2485143 RepID=UPI000F4948CD|nr:ABC transporter permease [Micromonospora sp. Llam0]ROO52294.1 putative ABC transport system permease protein [Micromonospora sp. Llam0]